MKIELIPPDTLTSQLRERLQILKEALEELSKNKKNQPEGHLRVAQKGNGRPQYYQYISPDDLTGKYIRKKDIDFAGILAQKDYEKNIIPLFQKEITALEEYLARPADGHIISEFYDNLCPARQRLITPITLTDEQYISQWQNVTWTGHPFSQDAHIFYTARNERVRSKSEVLIADALTRHGIVYRYEYPVQLHHSSNSGTPITFYPDFLCLNVRTRVEFYWEHFGRMDNTDYSNNATAKLRLYTENGILPGRNLIITMETQTEPLSTRTLNQMIEAYLL